MWKRLTLSTWLDTLQCRLRASAAAWNKCSIDDAAPGTMRHVQRIREISVQANCRGHSTGTSEKSPRHEDETGRSKLRLQNSDIVDFHRTSSTKDASSWKGPAKVIDSTNMTRGTLTIRYQRDMPIEVRLQDVRRHLDYCCFLAGQYSPLDPGSDTRAHLRAVVDGSQQGKPTCVGMAFTTQGWQLMSHKGESPEA